MDTVDIERITDPADPRVAPYRAVKERDLVGRRGHFIAEGEVVLRVALTRGRFPLQSLLIAEQRLEAQAPLFALVPEGVPVYAASQPVLDGIAGFSLHRGLLALGLNTPSAPLPPALEAVRTRTKLAANGTPQPLLCPIGLSNHDNMGALFRNGAAFGVTGLVLDATCCDPLYRKAIRVSVGNALSLPFLRLGAADALIDDVVEAGFQPLALTPRGEMGLPEVSSILNGQPPALILGSEGPGLPASILSKVQGVRIPMTAGLDSLNVATAAAIALYGLQSAS